MNSISHSAITAKVICDSISPQGHRLTTFVVTYPKFIQAEINTHRVLSRNAASARAIPTALLINKIKNDPFVPAIFTKNQKGMWANDPLPENSQAAAREAWIAAAQNAVQQAQKLLDLGVSKGLANRLLEPFMVSVAVISGTDWDNFFLLRCHKAAQTEFQDLASKMREAIQASTPKPVANGSWHLPFVDPVRARNASLFLSGSNIEPFWDSVACCARVSYMKHDGTLPTSQDNKALFNMLLKEGHYSPFEHQATPVVGKPKGNFTGWAQLRHQLSSITP
jgi:thymidylate synthase ThyX